MFWIAFISSLLVVAFGQPAWVPGLGIIAACIGFACFWRAMLLVPRTRDRFILSVIWYTTVQGIQLSWMTSSHYMGPYIFLVFLFLVLGCGIQFGLLSFFFKPGEPLSYRTSLGIAGTWAIMEWSRIFFLTGYTWNPVGLALSDSSYSLQLATIWGVFGLSFWVILVNAAGLKALFLEKTKKSLAIWVCLAIFPYVFGFCHQMWAEGKMTQAKTISVVLVQTSLFPEQKDYWKSRRDSHVPALDQWERIFSYLEKEEKIDLIVLPEAALPLGAHREIYPLELVKFHWQTWFGAKALEDLPPLQPPFAVSNWQRGAHDWKVNNAFLCQAFANHFNAHVIIGLDDHDIEQNAKYNAAFHFQPQQTAPQRYEKRVLVPVSEYVPLQNWNWISSFLLDNFGIGESFDPGTEAKIFHAAIPIGVSICIEETFSNLIRDLRLKGAELFVNISNDVWFPASRLPQQHFDHGRVRAVENGVCSVRSCNTGVTGAVDCFGRLIKQLEPSETDGGALYLSLPVRSYKTLYTLWGDGAILGMSLGFAIFGLLRWKKKLP